MNPYHYVVFSESPGYRAMAKQRDKSIQGIIVVRKDSHIKSIEDLKECTLAFPAPAAFAASILPRSYFLKNNFNITPKYVSSHDSVYRNVASGKLIAGGGVKRTFATVDQNVSSQLRILWTTDRYTPHAFAYHPSIDKKVIAAIQKSFLSLEDTDGMKRLNEINFKGIQAAHHDDWNDVRALPINIIQ
jgi:phosphonate transport system substrate-binding protein